MEKQFQSADFKFGRKNPEFGRDKIGKSTFYRKPVFARPRFQIPFLNRRCHQIGKKRGGAGERRNV